MNVSLVAKIYERSLRVMAKEEKVSDLSTEFSTIMNLVEEHEDLKRVFFLEVFSPSEKRVVINDLFQKIQISQVLKNFILYLVEERRIEFLPMIYHEYMLQESLAQGMVKGVIYGAAEAKLGTSEMKEVEKIVESKLKTKVTLTYKENAQIVAGYRIIVNDYLLDA
ncbi:MAG: ATP synthase F1 subunit delta, partial [Oligoflexia bacterium]|nr:ATP synthase F1 subunit delta [Oligoflexia bacterium]